RRRDNNRVRHRASFFETRYHPGNGGLLLTTCDIDTVERTIRRITGGFCGSVEPGLIDDRVYADGRLAGGAVADDQFALAAANRDHRVDRHDARLHGFAQHVHDAPEQTLAHGHLQELTGGTPFVAFFELGVISKNNHADFSLFEI